MTDRAATARHAAPLPADAFLREAVALGDDLVAESVTWGEYTTWVGRHIVEGASKPEEAPTEAKALHFNLYGGLSGIALFLGHLHRFTQDAAHHETARGAILEAVRQAQRAVDDHRPERKKEIYGVYAGAMGVFWAAHELAQILREPYLAERASFLLEGLRREVDNDQTETDGIGGHAGAIPALLSLHRNQDVAGARELALALGERLVARAVTTPKGAWAWDRVGRAFPAPLTGFTHGTAGYAYAFALLHRETGEERWADAARRAIQYERDTFDAAQGGWPDFRWAAEANGSVRCSHIWCHGSGGIGVSRVLMRDILQDPRCDEETEIARRAIGRHTRARLEVPGHLYHLCHGVAGNAECLWIMEAGLGAPGALARAREVGRYGIERYGHAARARWRSRFVDWPSAHPGHREPSLMLGVAGIGYHYLRLHAPDRVPSVLVPGLSWRDAATVPFRGPDEAGAAVDVRAVEAARA